MRRDPLKLGIFMPNCSYSMSISTYKPVPDDWTYAENLRIASAAERCGFDFLFPVAKWRGMGGQADCFGTSLETLTWASALLANTQRIEVYSTVHVPVFHPLVVAKMGVTMDHISGGRWGLNVVSGSNRAEFEMMGISVLEHSERYRRTSDYIRVIKGLWTDESGAFDFASPWYRIRGGRVSPQPIRKPHPPIVNAGTSAAALDVVAALCDWCFMAPSDLDATRQAVARVKSRAADHRREVRCVAATFPIWGDTREEAEAVKEHLLAGADHVAIKNWLEELGFESSSLSPAALDNFCLGCGSYPIVGDREDVAAELSALYEAGVDGVLMSFVSYHDDTLRFAKEVAPLLRGAGIVAVEER